MNLFDGRTVVEWYLIKFNFLFWEDVKDQFADFANTGESVQCTVSVSRKLTKVWWKTLDTCVMLWSSITTNYTNLRLSISVESKNTSYVIWRVKDYRGMS